MNKISNLSQNNLIQYKYPVEYKIVLLIYKDLLSHKSKINIGKMEVLTVITIMMIKFTKVWTKIQKQLKLIQEIIQMKLLLD